jgi:hypothetical protein
VAGTCECSNEPLGSIKCGDFLDWLSYWLVLKKDCAPWSSIHSSRFLKLHSSFSQSVG